MARLSLILLAVLALAAVGLVTSQHKARKLFSELEKEQERARSLDVEWGQLQLEQSTWAMQSRVERVARQALHMRVPDSKRVQILQLAPPAVAPAAQEPPK
jgi:cell division protein FtsL